MGSTIKFDLRTDQPNKDGCCQIRLIYQIKGARKYFVPGKSVFPASWDQTEQRAIYLDRKQAKKALPLVNYNLFPDSDEVAAINEKLATLKKELRKIETAFEESGVVYSTEMVIDKLKNKTSSTTKDNTPTNQVYDFIDRYIEDNKASRVKGSLSVYKSLKNHLENFQNAKRKKITFDKIDYAFFLEFQNFLIGTKARGAAEGLGNVTIAKILSTFKTFLNYAKMNGVHVSPHYSAFKIKKEKLEVIALTNDEFETLYNLDLSEDKALDRVRDVFCFSCATGLRYSDLSQLKREHINLVHEEINLTVTKTKELLHIPLNPYSYAILLKYKKQTKPLPVISNVRMNEHVKDLCELAKINEPVQIVRYRGAKREENIYPKHALISVHTARKTFATLSLEKGISAEEVMKIGGWKTYASFSRYVNITNTRSKVVMKKAWGEIPRASLKAV